MPRPSPLLLLALVGCRGKGSVGLPDSTSGDTTAVSDSSDDSGDSADSGTDSGADTGDTATLAYAPVSDVSWVVNPKVATVLEVSWTQDVDAAGSWLEFSFEDEDWQDSPDKARPAGSYTEAILGVPADTDVQFRIVNRAGDGTVLTSEDTWTGTTGSLPAGLPLPTLESYDASLASPERYLLSSVDESTDWYHGPFWLFILDRKGRYVWYDEVPDSKCALFPQISGDGTHVVFDECTVWVFDDTLVPGVGRTTLDEAWTAETELPEMRYALEEIDDGTLFYDREESDTYTLVEHSPDGTERDVWSCSDWIKGLGLAATSCLPNAIVYHAETDSLLWSMFGNSTVVEIDRSTGEILRQFGQLPGSYGFDPTSSMVDYQHYPNYAPDGSLMLSTHIPGDTTSQQREREYTVDDADGTMVETWEYGSGVDEYAAYNGEAVRLANDNTLINYGTGGALREVTYDKVVAWQVRWPTDPSTHLLGHQSLLDDLYALNQGPEDR